MSDRRHAHARLPVSSDDQRDECGSVPSCRYPVTLGDRFDGFSQPAATGTVPLRLESAPYRVGGMG
jgi:hypothetical protein